MMPRMKNLMEGEGEQSMPNMMQVCMNMMGSEKNMESIQDMMKQCMASMSGEERERMRTFCHRMMEGMEGEQEENTS
jgi:hypothetical protein